MLLEFVNVVFQTLMLEGFVALKEWLMMLVFAKNFALLNLLTMMVFADVKIIK